MLLEQDTFRQYFRIVTSNVSFWYKDHSTPNPRGVVPDPSITKTVVGNKFSKDGLQISTTQIRSGGKQMTDSIKKLKIRNQKRCDYHQVNAGSCDLCGK